MTVYAVQHSNAEIEFANQTTAENYATANSLAAPTVRTKIEPDLGQANKDANLSLEESNQMFDNYNDVLIKVKHSDLATAVTLLEAKEPAGPVTQDLINTWVTIIQGYL